MGNFDKLIEGAAKAPRDAGLAPTTAAAYASQAQKTAAREAEWKSIDTQGRGAITFDDFLKWALQHIGEKVAEFRSGKRYQATRSVGSIVQAPVTYAMQPQQQVQYVNEYGQPCTADGQLLVQQQ